MKELRTESPEQATLLTEVVAEAIDEVARSKSEKEIGKLRHKNEELIKMLDKTRAAKPPRKK